MRQSKKIDSKLAQCRLWKPHSIAIPDGVMLNKTHILQSNWTKCSPCLYGETKHPTPEMSSGIHTSQTLAWSHDISPSQMGFGEKGTSSNSLGINRCFIKCPSGIGFLFRAQVTIIASTSQERDWQLNHHCVVRNSAGWYKRDSTSGNGQ